MKTIDTIIIHCSATRAGQDLRAKDIDRMHKQRGFSQIGYNFVIDLDGMVENGRPLSIDERIVIPKDFESFRIISIVLASVIFGGLDASGKPVIHVLRLKKLLRELVAKLCKEYDIVEVLGHREHLQTWTEVEK